MVPSSAPGAADPARRRTRGSPSWRPRCRRATWQAPAAEVGAGGGRRLGHRPRSTSSAAMIVLQADPVGQALAGPQVVVLEVERLEPGVAGAQAVALGVAVDQAVLGDPVDESATVGRIALEAGEHRLPAAPARRRRPPRRPPPARASARTCGPARAAPTAPRARSPAGRCAAGSCASASGRG